jgi:hypothetical protein
MGSLKRCIFLTGLLAGCAAVVLLAAGYAAADSTPNTFAGSFAFPSSLANGVSGNLVQPAGSASKLTFDTGMVAIGQLPLALPVATTRGGRRTRTQEHFVRPTDAGPHVRLLLSGVVDPDGSPVTNTGNQLVIDAMVSPSDAGTPPFIIPFDINAGNTFIDALLPIQAQAGKPVRLQILGVTVIDSDKQPFAVLGFDLPPAPPTPVPRATPTPGGSPRTIGQCFVGANCTGPSFTAAQQKCCLFNRRALQQSSPPAAGFSWCPPEQFDPSTGTCAANACVACAAPPPLADCGDRPECTGTCSVQCPDGHREPGICQQDSSCRCSANCNEPSTPTPGPCADAAACSGACMVTCPDGTNVAGKCGATANNRCECSAACTAPTPCGGGQCFDTVAQMCTGQACGPGLRCLLPNQLCDVSGRRCPCQPPPPPLPRGHLCCECKSPGPACFDFSFVEVQPICPPGCETFMSQECDGTSNTCAPLTPCSGDTQCDDGNGCTIDRCTPDGCTHECICVGPGANCGPGPARGTHP